MRNSRTDRPPTWADFLPWFEERKTFSQSNAIRFYLSQTEWNMNRSRCMTSWSSSLFDIMVSHPSRVDSIDNADVVFVDWETALETNYPMWGGFWDDVNWVHGTHVDCISSQVNEEAAAAVIRQDADVNKKVIVFDARGNPQVYEHPDVIVAAMDLSETRHRRQDISMPTATPLKHTGTQASW